MIFDNLKNDFFLKPLQIRKKSVPLHSQSETMPNGVVVQLVRIPACHAGGRGFESRPYRFRVRSYIG